VFCLQLRNKRRSTRTSDRKAAELYVAQLERRIADPTYRAADGTTLGRAFKAFYAQHEERGRARGVVNVRRVAALLRELADAIEQDAEPKRARRRPLVKGPAETTARPAVIERIGRAMRNLGMTG
jgi:hypothetical protein